ncbi:MAG: aldolase/citrate lyase family protein, partial [Pseudomonadota bacterium]
MKTLDFGRSERLIRLNPPFEASDETISALFEADFAETIEAQPDGYVISKVEDATHLQLVSDKLDSAEQRLGWPVGTVRLLAVVETALGIMNLKEIAQASPRLEALMFGAEDLAGDIGAQRTATGWEVFYARSAVVTAAAAYKLQALDMVLTDLANLARLTEESKLSRRLGYTGKMAIHPRQVEVINRIFGPSDSEIAQAQRLVQAHNEHQAAGSGAFELDGKMVDMPIVRAAEQVLARAKAAGILRKHRPTSDAVPAHWNVRVALPPDYFFYMRPSRFWPSLALSS